MNKKGNGEIPFKESWGLIRAFAIILVVLVIWVKVFFFVNPVYAQSKNTLERLHGVLETLDDGESRSINIDLEKGIWLLGFNKDKNFIEHRRTVRLGFRQTITISKPNSCPIDKACLCLCTDECKKFSSCKIFEGIELFVVIDISPSLNGGVDYEDREGSYLAMPGKGVMQFEISRENDIIYIGSYVPEKGDARQEFERFVSFAGDIGVRYPGTCKLVFEIDMEKLTEEFYIVVYKDGNAMLFLGEGEQRRNIATQTIKTAPVFFADIDDVDEIFEKYDELHKADFTLPYTVYPPGPDPTGLKKSIRLNKVVLLQRNGDWVWIKQDPDFVDKCES